MSCGCLQREQLQQRRTIHGGTAGKGERLYTIWRGVKDRCGNPRCRRFSDYGGRGIKVCAEWLDNYPAFRSWALQNGYTDTLTIDRINNDLGYAPNNCRWATRSEQEKNKRKSRPQEVQAPTDGAESASANQLHPHYRGYERKLQDD